MESVIRCQPCWSPWIVPRCVVFEGSSRWYSGWSRVVRRCGIFGGVASRQCDRLMQNVLAELASEQLDALLKFIEQCGVSEIRPMLSAKRVTTISAPTNIAKPLEAEIWNGYGTARR